MGAIRLGRALHKCVLSIQSLRAFAVCNRKQGSLITPIQMGALLRKLLRLSV